MPIRTEPKAFPYSVGYGKNVLGGSGGTVYEVTNLNNSGVGSFREACEASGARTVVFRIGGRIDVSSTITISDPNISIYGQTAPGDGITVTAEGTPNIPVLHIQADQVIIQYITFRRSELEVSETNSDNLTISGCSDIIVDHCSFSWASDENLAIYDYNGAVSSAGTSNITVQNCLFDTAWGGSDKGALCAGAIGELTFFRNVWTSQFQRKPLIKNDVGDYTTADVEFEVINNITFEGKWHTQFTRNDGASGDMSLNFISNLCIDSNLTRNQLFATPTNDFDIYVKDNLTPLRTSITSPVDWDEEWSVLQGGGGSGDVEIPPSNIYQSQVAFNTPIIVDGDTILSTDKATLWAELKDHVGASFPTRDTEDARAINDVETEIDTAPATSGTFPTLAAGAPLTDSNNDGIPDTWTTANMGGDAYDDIAPSGYTWLEEYVDQLTNPVVGDIPVITLIGAPTINLENGDTYNELGAIASDTEDGDITGSIVITGIVDTGTDGTYFKYYNVQDSDSNNAVQVTRTINVTTNGGGNVEYPLTALEGAYGQKNIKFLTLKNK